jgi:gliding motility-associated-like protein
LPKISILNEDTSICRTANMMIPVTATYSNTSGITWVPFKGSVSDNKAKTTNYSFTSPADTVGRVSLYVQTEPGNACPFVDDIYFVTIHPIPNVTLTVDDPKGCNPHSTSMTAAINNKIDPATATYAWTYSDGGSGNTATVNHQFTTNGTNTIDLIVKSAFGCDTTVTTDVEVYPIPTALFTPDPNNSTTAALPRFRFGNKSTVDNVLGSFIETNEWDFGDPTAVDDTSTQINPVFFYPADTGTYMVTLRVTTNYGCTDEFSYPVIIGPDILVFIPNAFSPDVGGPTENEGFRAVVNNGVKDYHMIIFNRWGEVMYETTDPNAKWDGTFNGIKVQQDVYAYYLKVSGWNNKEYTFSGTITLLR